MALSDSPAGERSRIDPTIRASAAPLSALDWIALVLMVIGGLNWGLVGLFNLDLVATVLGAGSMAARAVYVLVGLAAVWGIVLGTRRGSQAAAARA